ncbi:serine/threonine-protein kinase [Nonomuraea sp. NPDC050310]|uniref:serine/threonine-protein kinase n=1 Tax=Nonomuraea sp. NPDC050310 TaxID=3154935 RepID=UPI0033F19891
MTTLAPGDPQRLDRYWLAGRLGAGGQGVVYEAYDEAGDRVAIKLLHGDASRTAKEVEAARRVASFCTARIIEARLDGPRPYIVSEFVDGPSLRQAVQRGRRFGPDELRRLATGIATALAAIHQAGVVHRDLKPANVLLGPDGPRVIDFGIARTAEMSLTTAHVMAGTPTYMAPEVFAGERATAASDVFAWGAVVLFAATARDPFEAESLGGVMYQVLSREPDTGMLAEPLRGLVHAALAKDPRSRPDAGELLWALVGGDDLAGGSRAAAGLAAPRVSERALGELAEEVYAGLGRPERDLVPEVFLRMVEADEEGADAVRRVSREELTDGRREADSVIGAFAGAGLITEGQDSVAIAHPALLRAWPQLRLWLEDERAGLVVHRGLSRAARQWHTGGRRDGDLYQGSALEDALGWAATGRRRLSLNRVETEFLGAAARLARRRTTRRRVVSASLALLLVAALGAAGFAEYQRRIVAEQRDEAVAKDVARRADSLRATDPELAMRLSVAAWRLAPVTEARSALYRAQTQPEVAVFTEPDLAHGVRALSPDGRVLVSAAGRRVRVWDVPGRRALGDFRAEHPVEQAAVDAKGRLALLAKGRVTLHDPTGRQSGGAFDGALSVESAGPLLVLSIGQPGAAPTGAATWDGEHRTDWPGVSSWDLSPSPDGSRLAVERGRAVEIWDTARRELLRRVETGQDLHASALSPRGDLLAVSFRGEIRFYDTATGARREALTLHQPRGSLLAFSADGRHLLVTQSDSLGHSFEALAVWRLGELAGRPWKLSFGYDYPHHVRLDGARARYLTTSGQVTTIDLAPVLDPPGAGNGPLDVAERDGRLVVTERGRTLAEFRASTPQASFRYALAGSLLAYGEAEGNRIHLWDARTRRETGVLEGPAGVGALRFSPDGRLLAADASLWDVPGRKLLRTFPGLSDIVALGPGGRALANRLDTAYNGGGQGLWSGVGLDTSTGAVTALPLGYLGGAAFSPDGRTVAVGDNDGRLQFLDATTWRRTGPVLGGHTDDIGHLVFSPDGALLATTGNDPELRLWDVAGRRLLGLPVQGASGAVRFAGGWLYAGGRPVLAVGGDLAARAVCDRAGGGLGEREWRDHLPDVPYRETCPGGAGR